MLTEEQRIRMEFARQANLIFAHEMKDEDRKAYWDEVLEPIWDGLLVSWTVYGLPEPAEWQLVLRQAIMPAASPSQWRAKQWRQKADKKAAKTVKRIQKQREWRAEVLGEKEKKAQVNTKAFWQGQSFGAASPVRKIDPATYKPDKD